MAPFGYLSFGYSVITKREAHNWDQKPVRNSPWQSTVLLRADITDQSPVVQVRPANALLSQRNMFQTLVGFQHLEILFLYKNMGFEALLKYCKSQKSAHPIYSAKWGSLTDFPSLRHQASTYTSVLFNSEKGEEQKLMARQASVLHYSFSFPLASIIKFGIDSFYVLSKMETFVESQLYVSNQILVIHLC